MATEPSSTNGNGQKMYQISLYHLVIAALSVIGSVVTVAGGLAWNHSISLQLLTARVLVNEKRLDYIFSLADKRGDEDTRRDTTIARMGQEIADLRRQLEQRK